MSALHDTRAILLTSDSSVDIHVILLIDENLSRSQWSNEVRSVVLHRIS